METIIAWRNAIIAFLYQNLLKRIFFLSEPQKVHDRMVIAGNFFGRNSWGRGLFRLFFDYNNPKLRQTLAGLEFKNPVGLAAGFDKEAMLPSLLPAMGFGFEEVGSITFQPYAGNVGKWMWRLPEAKSLRINYGLKNSGANNIHSRLSRKKFNFILGISIAKTNSSLTSVVEQGIDDYLQSYRIFQNTGDYFTINISCPNTSEPSPIFAEPENLDLLLQKLFSIPKTKPVFIKLSPDLTEEKLNGILALGNKYQVDGFICTNLTKVNKFNHEGKGGFSGKAVEELSNQMLAKVYKYYGGKKIVIGCGGIFSAEDAYKKIKLGASLVQLITGMIYQGPQLVSQINQGLVKLLERDGYANINEAVGKGV